MKHAELHYTLVPQDPAGHLYEVSLHIEKPQTPFEVVYLPNWIPGSYLIRDFSKHLIAPRATTLKGGAVELQALDKSRWQFASSGEAVEIRYQVYAWDLSVRGAHFDESHAFFNGTSVFLAVQSQRGAACTFELQHSAHSRQQQWRVATGMPALAVDKDGFGLYGAQNYDELIDYPFELGNFHEICFEACGIPHKMVLTGLFECDFERLKQDLTKICETEIRLFGEPAVIDQYVFQVMVTGNDYGGLEHRNSTALMCSRDDLPYPGMQEATDAYLQFLELCSHEYFHLWNVKRIQPAVIQQSDLLEPAFTNQLWWFEGVTSYYDALILLRAGLIDQKRYLKLLAEQMTRVYRMPGRFKQSVAQSSWHSWTKFYQQDENAPNAIISYYTKGSLIALALDLKIRQQTLGAKSLDDVLLHLWQHYGQTGRGLQEYEIEKLCAEVSGLDLGDFFNRYLYGTEDLPFESLFADENIDFNLRAPVSLGDKGGCSEAAALSRHLGVNVVDTEHQTVKITHVWHDQAAHLAGLSAGDEIIAVNGLKIASVATLENRLKRSGLLQQEVVWQCHYFRRDELRATRITLLPPVADRVQLQLNGSSAWLNGQTQIS
ncbi:MAG: M61 family metallopeptidase [Gammaproteobacteria bacterium]|nr:M61 family metallopeptidase [Gammaproteobacteria bacterium]